MQILLVDSIEKGRAKCTWIDKNSKPQEKEYSVKTLKKASKTPLMPFVG